MAVLSSVLLNLANQMFRDPKKAKPKMVQPIDLMPDWLGERKADKPDDEQLQKKLLSWAKSLGAIDKRQQSQESRKPMKRTKLPGADQ